MPRNFNVANLAGLKWNDPRVATRVVLGVLLAANLAAAVFAFKPFGGGADDLRRERQDLQRQLAQVQAQANRARSISAKVQQARTEGDKFLDSYITERRVVTSTIQGDLMRMAKEAGITLLPNTWNIEPIEGSDSLAMMTISANCTGAYANLAKFVNLVDKSDRFLILESMVAAPLQTGTNLNVSLKIDTFVKDHAGDAE
jgi:type IV pilus assembly protein PilO